MERFNFCSPVGFCASCFNGSPAAGHKLSNGADFLKRWL